MGLFNKTTKTAPAKGAEKKKKSNGKPMKMAKSVQEVLDFEAITIEGTIVSKGGNYSRLYSLTDSNFITESDERQGDIILDYAKFVNRFPDNVEISIVIVNKRNTTEQLSKSYHLKPQGDGFDNYRDDYNHIIDEKIKDGHNDISKDKYILMNVHADNLSDANITFDAAEISLQEAIK